MSKADYSEKELEMIKCLSPHWYRIIEDDVLIDCTPVRLYEIIAIKCFLGSVESPAVESLRRCLEAINNCKPYRMTPEFDELIRL